MKEARLSFALKAVWSPLSIFAALTLALALPGCARHRVRSKVVELTFAHELSVITHPVYQRALDEFTQQHPNIRVRHFGVAGDYYSKLMVMIAGNTAPDLMWMGQGFGEFAQRGALLDIDHDVSEGLNLNDYFQSVIDWYRLKGRLYGFPFGIDCQMIYYNKDLFRRAGEPYPNDNWNLEQFLQTCVRLMRSHKMQGSPDFYALGGIGGIDRGAFGASLLSPDHQRCLLDSPESIEAAQFNYDLKERYHVSPSMAQGTEGALDNNQAFKFGKLAMLMGYTWDLISFQREIKSFDWDIVMPPAGRRRAVWASSSGIVVYARTPHPREAVMLLRQLISPRYQFPLCRYTGTIPTHRPSAERWARETPSPPENRRAFVEAIPYLNPSPRVIALSEILDKVNRANERVMLGRSAPREAMQVATEQVNEVIQRQKRLLAHHEGRR